LAATGKIQLCGITQGKVSSPKHQIEGNIEQWIIPAISTTSYHAHHLPDSFVENVAQVITAVSPDLIHIWGTEGIWGLFTARGIVSTSALLEMQGLKYACAEVYDGGLSFREKLACIGIKDILRQTTIFQGRRRFEQWGHYEREIIAFHKLITVQTLWIEAHVKAVNNHCHTFYNDLMLRKPFYINAPWECSKTDVIFCLSSARVSYKGLHIAIRALKLLKDVFPNAQLRIGGDLQKTGLRQDGYIAWLNREAMRLGIGDRIVWLGRLDAVRVVEEMRIARAMILPTYIENCSTTMQEAMLFGIPLVVSFVGGLPSLAKDGESALFFTAGNVEMCAYQLRRLLEDDELAQHISTGARNIALIRNNPERIVQRQLEIYKEATGKIPKI
jgi:glycosyltransferase involved in cell wall biosynthesis